MNGRRIAAVSAAGAAGVLIAGRFVRLGRCPVCGVPGWHRISHERANSVMVCVGCVEAFDPATLRWLVKQIATDPEMRAAYLGARAVDR